MSLSIEPKILAHPWYRAWECGALPTESLKSYAKQYYWQVANFPRYLSRIHSQLEDLKSRQAILANLADEENAEAPHPELWLDFAESLGADRQEVRDGVMTPAARELVETFRALAAASPEEGLGAILAYESQVPEVARFKAKALKDFYLRDAERAETGTRFFAVHEQADVWHTQALEELLESLPAEKKQKAQAAAHAACKALWKFLDRMEPQDALSN